MISNDGLQSDNDELLKEYVTQLSVGSHNTRQLFGVGMVGIVGSGKSTLARRLAEMTNAYVTSNDVIRRFLNSKGFAGDRPIQETLQYIAESSGKYLYERQVSHIIDADLLKFYDLARRNAVEAGAGFYLIKVQCPEGIVRERVTRRNKQPTPVYNEDYSRADMMEYERRKAIYDESTEPEYDFVVHSDRPLDSQIEKICERLWRDGVID